MGAMASVESETSSLCQEDSGPPEAKRTRLEGGEVNIVGDSDTDTIVDDAIPQLNRPASFEMEMGSILKRQAVTDDLEVAGKVSSFKHLTDQEASSIKVVGATGAMASVQGENSSLCCEDGGPPGAKRTRLEGGEVNITCEADTDTIVDDAIPQLNRPGSLEMAMGRILKRLSVTDELDALCTGLDKMERDIEKMREYLRLEPTALPDPPEIHFFDDFSEADGHLEKLDVASPLEPAPSTIRIVDTWSCAGTMDSPFEEQAAPPRLPSTRSFDDDCYAIDSQTAAVSRAT